MKIELSKKDVEEAVANYLRSRAVYVDHVDVTVKRDGTVTANVIEPEQNDDSIEDTQDG